MKARNIVREEEQGHLLGESTRALPPPRLPLGGRHVLKAGVLPAPLIQDPPLYRHSLRSRCACAR